MFGWFRVRVRVGVGCGVYSVGGKEQNNDTLMLLAALSWQVFVK